MPPVFDWIDTLSIAVYCLVFGVVFGALITGEGGKR